MSPVTIRLQQFSTFFSFQENPQLKILQCDEAANVDIFCATQTLLSFPPCRLELTLNYSLSPHTDDSVKSAQIKHIRLFKQTGSGPLSSQQCPPASQPASSIYIHNCEKSLKSLEIQPCCSSPTYVLFQSVSLFICLFLFLALSASLLPPSMSLNVS